MFRLCWCVLSSLFLTTPLLSHAYTTGSLKNAGIQALQQLNNTPAQSSTLTTQSSVTPQLRRYQAAANTTTWRANGTVLHMTGKKLHPASSARSGSLKKRQVLTALSFLAAYRQHLQIDDPEKELQLSQQSHDILTGGARLRFEQRYHNLPVWPAELSVYLNAQGDVNYMQGAYVPSPRRQLITTPQLSAQQVQQQVLTAYPDGVKTTEASLIIYAPVSSHSPRLAWRFHVFASVDEKILTVVDAITGDILTEFNEIHGINTVGSGTGLHGDTRPLNVFEENNTFFLADTSKAMFAQSGTTAPDPQHGSILVFDGNNQAPDKLNDVSLIHSNNQNNGFLQDGVSAAFNLSETYDYFFQSHQRNSLDGQGGSILAVVRVGQNLDNAFWNGNAMFFGDALPFAADLDVVAHELTHGVIQHSAGLIYQAQSGALNEAFADILGEMAEARTKGKVDWVLGGEELNNTVFRSFINPAAHRQPAKMSDFVHLPNTVEGDNGGVHINSGIINHAYYLLAEGLENAIGTADAEQIFYRTLTHYLSKNSQFIDARLAVEQSAIDLFGQDSKQFNTVQQAFDAVEITNTAPTTQEPRSFPSVENVADATLFACMSTLGTVHVCRFDPTRDQQPILLSTHGLQKRRISVSGNGIIAAFVSSDNDACLLRTDTGAESCFNMPKTIHSIAISPDGNRMAFVLLKPDLSVDNKIVVIDLQDETEKNFVLTAPVFDSDTNTDTITQADNLVFTSDSRTLIYDAQNILPFINISGQSTSTYSWTLYRIDAETGAISLLINPVANLDMGFPNLSKTSDNFIVFDIFDANSRQLEIRTLNLNTGVQHQIAHYTGVLGIPTYNGDDQRIIYSVPDTNGLLGHRLVSQTIKNRMEPIGEPSTWLENAFYGTLYRQGDYVGQQAVAGFFDVSTGIMRIWLDYPTQQGTTILQLDMAMIAGDSNSFTFQLFNYAFLENNTVALRSQLITDNLISVPRASITDLNGNTDYWQYNLNVGTLSNGQLGFLLPAESLLPVR